MKLLLPLRRFEKKRIFQAVVMIAAGAEITEGAQIYEAGEIVTQMCQGAPVQVFARGFDVHVLDRLRVRRHFGVD